MNSSSAGGCSSVIVGKYVGKYGAVLCLLCGSNVSYRKQEEFVSPGIAAPRTHIVLYFVLTRRIWKRRTNTSNTWIGWTMERTEALLCFIFCVFISEDNTLQPLSIRVRFPMCPGIFVPGHTRPFSPPPPMFPGLLCVLVTPCEAGPPLKPHRLHTPWNPRSILYDENNGIRMIFMN